MYKDADEKRPRIANPERFLVGLGLSAAGALVVLINLTMTVDHETGILNPFLWGAVGLYGIGVMIWGALQESKQ